MIHRKDHKLEDRLIAGRPDTKGARSPRTLEIMDKLKTAATFSNILRTTDTKLNRRQSIMRQLTLPRKAIVAFTAILILSGAAVGAYALHQSQKTQDALDKVGQNQNIQHKAKPKPVPAPAPTPPAAVPQPASLYVDITEWGVRVTFDGADKVTYRRPTQDPQNDGAYTFFLKDSVASVCQDLGIGIVRSTNPPAAGTVNEGKQTTKINNYYYYLVGAPGGCDEDPGGPDGSINQLRKKLIGATFTISAIQ